MTRGHVLVFTEDDPSCSAAIAHWAGAAGCEVSVAASEHEAYESLRSCQLDVYFSSRLWPISGPLQTLGALRADHPELRIVYVPNPKDELALIPLARASGVHAVLRRALDRNAVLEQIEAAMAAGRKPEAPR